MIYLFFFCLFLHSQAIVHTPPRNANSQNEMETLRKQLNEYKSEINQLKNVVQQLSSENSQLKSKFSSTSNNSVYDEPLWDSIVLFIYVSFTIEFYLFTFIWVSRIDLSLNSPESEHEPMSLPVGSSTEAAMAAADSTSSNGSSNQSTIKRPASMYERRAASNLAKGNNDVRNTTSMYQMAGDGKPFGEEVKVRSDKVTRRLKELIQAMHPATEAEKQSIAPHGERIRSAVTDLIALYTNLVSATDDFMVSSSWC